VSDRDPLKPEAPLTTRADSALRNPTQKRGRPPSATRRRALAVPHGQVPRNRIDMAHAARRLDPTLAAELGELLERGETTLTVLAYVARFPREQQREAFEHLQGLGSRGAKRFVECVTRPPTVPAMSARILQWVRREFPPVDSCEIAEACRLAASRLEEPRGAS
jgi:hypothetical protein